MKIQPYPYQKHWIHLLSFFSPRLAAAKAFAFYCTPLSGKNLRNPPTIFHTAVPLSFYTPEGMKICGFQFFPEQPTQKKVLICHGFDSSSYRFSSYIRPLLKAGFQVFAFDAPAHGVSEGTKIHSFIYRNAILDIEKKFGPFNSIMAHSLGALAASLALETIYCADKRLVLIAPATEGNSSIENFFNIIKLNSRTRKAFEKIIQKDSGHPSSWHSVARAIQHIKANVLWVHDKQDKVCPFEDTLPVQQKQYAHVQFLITDGWGHSKVYLQPQVQKQIISFLSEGKHINQL